MKSYLDLILIERAWSWTLIGIVYLVVTFCLRQCIFQQIIRETKRLESGLYGAVRHLYLKNSIPGWVCYVLSLSLVILIWIKGDAPIRSLTPMGLALISVPLLFLLSVILHLTAFANALVMILRQRMGIEKEF